MNGRYIMGICIAFVLLGAFVGAASATTWHVEEDKSIHVGDEVAMPFYNDIITPHRMPSDHLIDEDEEYLAHEKHISFYKRLIPKHKLDKQIIGAAGTQKSNYTFSLHGNVNLVWSYVNDERDAEVDFDILDDVNGDGIVDVLASDCDSESKLFVISGKDGSTIWNKNYPAETWIDVDELDDVNGDGINDVIAYWYEYNRSSNQTNITIELLSGSNGDKIWGKKISYEGRYYYAGVHGTHGDLTGDGIEDILIEADSWWEQGVSVLHALNSKDGSKLWERTFNGDVYGYCYAWSDLTGDGINDFAVGSYNHNNNTGELFVIRGSDGYIEWYKSFVGDTGWPDSWDDFDGDGLNDVQIENNDAKNKTGKVFVFKGTNGSVIWSKSFNHRAWMFDLSDFDGDGIEEQCLILENFSNYRVEEIQVLSGIDGSLIWKKSVNVSQVGYSNDLSGDNKDDILLLNCTEIAENEYLHDVNAISGVDGSEIWEKTFSHDIEIEIPESEHCYEWSWTYGYRDLSGDGITDPLLETGCDGGYWDENASVYREYSANKLILINGKNGSEIWDVKCTADENIWLSTRTWEDFNNDGIKDVLLGTGKGVYLLTVSETPIPTLTFTDLTPSTITTSESTYDATLTATGSNFYNVSQITFNWGGPDSGSDTWNKGDSSWNTRVTVNSDTSMTLQPVVVYNEHSNSTKTWTWRVTLKDNTGATASRPFTVIYSPATYLKGIDISHYQHECKLCKDNGSGYVCPTDCKPIEWDNVSKYYKFVYIQTTQGDTRIPRLKDPMIEEDIKNATANGSLVGVYHLAYPSSNTAESEAQHFVNVSGEYLKQGYLQPMLDIEQGECDKFANKTVLVKWIEDWMDAVRQKTGNDDIKPILYTGCCCANAMKSKDPAFINELLNESRLWIARYPDLEEHNPSDNPPASYLGNPCKNVCGFDASKWGFWQWTDKTKVDGIPSNYVDGDIFNGDLPKLQTFIIPGEKPSPPTCKIELQKDGKKIDKIGVNESFNIVVANYSGDIKKVRFLSDELQNGKVDEGFNWTDWYDWNTSKEDGTGHWYASNKTKTWSFVTPGEKEVWAEVNDSNGQTAYCHAGIYASSAPAPGTIYVPDNYSKIQWAVDNASVGDTILVKSGTYHEHVNVNKQLTLRGVDTGSGKPVVGAWGYGSAITLSADGITLEGFEAKNSGGYSWEGNTGIVVTSDNNIIKNNTANSNNGDGIYLDSSSNNIIYNNTASNNWAGIYLYSSSNNKIYNNTASNNFRGIGLVSSSNNTLSNNSCFSNNYEGLVVPITPYDHTGIVLFSSSNNSIGYNNIYSNNNAGIILSSSTNNSINDNNIYSNGKYYGSCGGIYLDSSSNNNKIYLNNFNNANNIGSYSSTNIWNSTEKITYTYKGSQYTNYLGNYWSDYTGSDSDGDGIGDTSYPIYSDADNYPLMERFENYIGETPAPTLTFTDLQPSTITTNESTYDATLTATGSNFYNVSQVTFNWSGPDSGSDTWNKGDSSWNTRVTVNSDTSMTLQPRVLYNEHSNSTKTWAWRVTLKDNTGATASRNFTVIYAPATPAGVIYVPDNYSTIQQAVDNASVGDTIIVRSGTYYENVNVNKRLTIKSENGSSSTIVQAANPNDDVFEVTADYVNISGFTVEGATADFVAGSAIYIGEHCNISNNIICSNNGYGIVSSYSGPNSYNIIEHNTICNNSYGLLLEYSGNNTIANNFIINNSYYGIYLWGIDSINNTITNNNISNNNIGLSVDYDNFIYLNNFINNTENAQSGDNIWNSTSKITYTYKGKTYTNYLGNYWSDYTGSDADGDGIGDTTYSIDSDKDSYPLMERFENYFAPTGPTCKIELQKEGVKIDEIGVNEWFNIVITDYSGDIKKVRFLSDESQNGKVDEGFTWTDWYDWNVSKEDWTGHWYASNKTKTWSFVTPGEKEVWAEVKDDVNQTARCFAGIEAVQIPKILSVPYYSQGDTDWCVPTSMSMIFKYYGKNIHSWDIAKDWGWGRDIERWKFWTPFVTTVSSYFENHHLTTDTYYCSPLLPIDYDDLFNHTKDWIDRDTPVLLVMSKITHAVVIVGYEETLDRSKYVYINEPAGILQQEGIEMPLIAGKARWSDISEYIGWGSWAMAVGGESSPPKGTIDIDDMDGFYFHREEKPNRRVYSWREGKDEGITWRAVSPHPLWLDQRDLFKYDQYIANHMEDKQTYLLEIEFAKGGYSHSHLVVIPDVNGYSRNDSIMKNSIPLRDLLQENYGEYTINITLWNSDFTEKYDEITFPIIEYKSISPTVSISTNKYEYTTGETMLINITFVNPTGEWQPVYFAWRLDLLDYDSQYWIMIKPLYLPPDYKQTFTTPFTLEDYGIPFNASWYVALYNTTTLEVISEDTANWKYMLSKMGQGETIPEEIASEITKTVEANLTVINETYNYTIRTGSYPQIHHTDTLPTANGWINCTEFVDVNGGKYNDWIPAIRLE